MRSSTEHSCGHCHAVGVLRGAQVFVPLTCPACGLVSRARDEIAGYQLHEVLARSGLGIIFRAVDSAGAPLAVKLLQAPLASESTDVEYFVSEVWAIARLDHPNCLRIFATGVEQGVAWIAMEWLKHGSLADRLLERGRLREGEVLAIGAQAAAALGAAHAAGHAHRDVEPNNLVFADPRTVKVTDFGQAALYQIAGDDLGTMWGRTWYVSPERMRNEPEEAHSDIYSLGATLFHALTGTPLHGGEPNAQITLELLESGDVRVEGTVSPLHDKTALVLNRMLTSEPTQRFQHWSEVMAQLTQAAALVARRDAPAQQRSPTAPAKSSPRLAAPKPRKTSGARWVWLSVAFLGFAAGVGTLVWKLRAARRPATAPIAMVKSPSPIASPKPSPPPPSPAATPALSPAPAGFDWRPWKTAALEANRGTIKSSASVVPPSGALRMISNGSGFGGEKDEAGFHLRTIDGNWTLATHLVANDGAAGLCVRDSSASGGVSLAVWLTADKTVAAAVRKQADTKPALSAPISSPNAVWLRLARRGAVVTAEYSANAKQWKTIARLEGVPLSPKPVAGFIVWSGTKDRVATAVFDRMSISRVSAPPTAASPPRSPPPRSGSPPSSPPARVR